MAAVKAGASSTWVTQPLRPSSTTSAGPKSQAVTRAGAPQARASATTLGKPSQRDDSTNSLARAIQAQGLATKPGKITLSPTPSSAARARVWASSVPRPRITRS